MSRVCMLCLLLAFVSCKTKTLESEGGVRIYANINSELDDISFQRTADIIKERFKKYNGMRPEVSLDTENNRLKIELVGYTLEDCDGCDVILQDHMSFYISEVFSQEKSKAYIDQIDGLMATNDCYGLFTVEDTLFIERSKHPLFSILLPYQGAFEYLQSAETVMAQIKDTSLVMKVLRHPAIQRITPRQMAFAWNEQILYDKILGLVILSIHPSGEHLIDEKAIASCKVIKDEFVEESWGLSIDFKEDYVEVLRKMTSDNINGYLAFVVGGKVLGLPMVQEIIANGKLTLQGNMSAGEAHFYAAMLSSQPLKGLTGAPIVEYIPAKK